MSVDSSIFYFALIFLLFWNGAVWFYFIKAFYTYTWVKSKGKIIESSVVYDKGDGHGESYNVHAKYSYQFGSKEYEHNYVVYSGVYQFDYENEAREELKSLVVGSTVDVFVDRFNPKNAILKRVLPTKLISFLIAGGFGLLLLLNWKT